jgi:putative sigma-54 modulation protein
MMQISLTAKKIDLTPEIRDYAEEKIGKLDKFLEGIMEAHILLRVEKHRHIAEITLHAKQVDFTGKENNEDLYSAIDRASEKLERQLRKYKTRTLSRRKAKPVPANADPLDLGSISILGQSASDNGSDRPVIKEKFIHLEMLGVNEAISRMEVHGNDFWVFADSPAGLMSVVYRRKDGSYGLIQTQD